MTTLLGRLNIWYKSMPIKRRMILSFMLTMSLILLLIVVIVYRVSSSILINKSVENTLQNIKLISTKIDSILTEAEEYTNAAVTNRTVQEVLSNNISGDELRNYSDGTRITGALDNVVSARTLIESILILDLGGQMYDSGKLPSLVPLRIQEYDAFWELPVPYRHKWMDTHESGYTIKEKKQNILTYAKSFYNSNTGEALGVVLANINENTIADTYANVNLGINGQIFIINQGGMVLSSRDKTMLYRNIAGERYYPLLLGQEGGELFDADGVQHLVVYSGYEKTGWIIVGIVPTADLTRENAILISNIVVILLISMVLLSFSIVAISSSITKPIVHFKEAIEQVGDGDLETRVQVFYNDEVGTLAKSFNSMVERTSTLMDTVVGEQKKKRQYELSLLQSQINPHFLYNTLENICGLADLQRNDDIVLLVNELAQFYRGVLSEGDMVISIREELEMTRKYLNILGITRQEQLEYTIDVDDDVLPYPTIKLLLQPLVENAVQHGIKYKKGKGQIHIRGKLEEDFILITVSDNGVGIPPERLDSVFSQSSDCFRAKSFGLGATDQRIKLYFGSASGLSVQSEYTVGTTVSIRLSKNQLWNESPQGAVHKENL